MRREILNDVLEQGGLLVRPLGGLLGMPDEGNALVLEEGGRTVIENGNKVLPICLPLGWWDCYHALDLFLADEEVPHE